jgi:hypothetical protein
VTTDSSVSRVRVSSSCTAARRRARPKSNTLTRPTLDDRSTGQHLSRTKEERHLSMSSNPIFLLARRAEILGIGDSNSVEQAYREQPGLHNFTTFPEQLIEFPFLLFLVRPNVFWITWLVRRPTGQRASGSYYTGSIPIRSLTADRIRCLHPR